jgi:hypothetical protein
LTNVNTIGERIAREFSENKRHLTGAEQRRLAGMIDAATAQTCRTSPPVENAACNTRIDDADFGITQGVGYCVLPAGHGGQCSIYKII